MSDAILERCREILADGPKQGFTHDGFTVVQTAILESSTARILPVGVVVVQADGDDPGTGWALPFAEWSEAANRNLSLDPWLPDARRFKPGFKGLNHPAIGSRWRHYKGGEYEVVGIAFVPPRELDPLMIYQPLTDPSIRWARPLPEWDDVADYDGEARPVYRFTPMPESATESATPATDADLIDVEVDSPAPVVVPPAVEEPIDQWAHVELMGRQSMAGRISEEKRFGGKLARLDVPQPDGTFVTSWFGAQSVYRITIVTEDEAGRIARRSWPRPVTPYDPKAITSSGFGDDDDRDFDDEDLDDGF